MERMIEKALDVPDRVSILVRAGLPFAVVGIGNQVGEKYAVAEAGEVIDVGRRCVTGIDDAQPRLGLEALAQRGPRPGVARQAGSGGPFAALSGRGIFTFLVEPTQHSRFLTQLSGTIGENRPARVLLVSGCS